MSKKSNVKLTFLFTISISLIAVAITAFFLAVYYRHVCFQILGAFSERIIQEYPDSKQAVIEFMKVQSQDNPKADKNILSDFGYQPSHIRIGSMAAIYIAMFGFFTGITLLLFSFWYWHKKTTARIKALTDYLEKINTGGQGMLMDTSEDDFSKLQDEIYKTVTMLCQTRDAALTARNNFAENLSNIAHQLKTPITSISLSVQMAKNSFCTARTMEIKRQLSRLTHLEEALLLLSRIEAGTLILHRKSTDVFTLLTLASDNLYELFLQQGILIDIPEMGEVDIHVDLDWTMEAVMNLMKNCMEASESGAAVHCFYERNPLYVQIRIWDEGPGFAKEDFPHLFERFYRGRKRQNTGIGIGLSLSKAMIEMQNGILQAFNLETGGACFEIRFYHP